MNVLVFEASKDRAKLIRDLLNDYRYKIHINYSGEKALNDIQNLKPSLIIVHSNVQPDSGIGIVEKIKRNQKYLNIPVIMISHFASSEMRSKIKKYPNVDYLVEPFKIKNFRHIVERWINFRSLYIS
jgi:two-component system nitrogen regulation response regulator GlnG